MAGPRRKLQQGRRRAAVGFGALAGAKPAGQIVDEGRRRVAQRGKVDVALGLAASTRSRAIGRAAQTEFI